LATPGQGRAARGQALDRPLHAQGDFLEPIEGERAERLAGRMPRLGFVGAQNVHE
jgi:hypothetical protein